MAILRHDAEDRIILMVHFMVLVKRGIGVKGPVDKGIDEIIGKVYDEQMFPNFLMGRKTVISDSAKVSPREHVDRIDDKEVYYEISYGLTPNRPPALPVPRLRKTGTDLELFVKLSPQVSRQVYETNYQSLHGENQGGYGSLEEHFIFDLFGPVLFRDDGQLIEI